MRKKTAFSLVELSIVLIIIGLLVAGVVGGSSLIKSAALRTVMSEARNYGIITNSFFVSYDALPGDIAQSQFVSPSTSSLSSGCVGDADGQIEFSNNASTTLTALNAKNVTEGLCAIYQLKDSGMLQSENFNGINADFAKFKQNASTGLIVGVHYPQSKMRGNGWVYDFVSGTDNTVSSDSWRSVGNEAEPANVVFLVGEKMGAGTSTTVTELAAALPAQVLPSLSPADSRSIDSKIDDGLPKSGKVRAFGRENTALSGNDHCVVTSNPNYITENDGPGCVLGFNIDVLR
jgi:prepilin-type N-terminal cleavage/methylation domain-containing protein